MVSLTLSIPLYFHNFSQFAHNLAVRREGIWKGVESAQKWHQSKGLHQYPSAVCGCVGAAHGRAAVWGLWVTKPLAASFTGL